MEVRLIAVPHQFDFHLEKNAFPPELIKALRDSGHDVHFGTMLFHTDDFYGSNNATAMATLLRCFSQGVKVCFEIVLMVTDAGLVTSGEKVIAIAGTASGIGYCFGDASGLNTAPQETQGKRNCLQAPKSPKY